MVRMDSLAIFAVCLLAGCVPLPPRDLYSPNPADGTARAFVNGCISGALPDRFAREFGDVTVVVQMGSDPGTRDAPLADRADPDARLFASIGVSSVVLSDSASWERPLPGRVVIDTNRIRLVEDGRSRTGTGSVRQDSDIYHGVTVAFAAPSGISDTLRLTFGSGAVRVGGRALPMRDVRFTRVTETTTGSLFCIPV